MAAANVKVGEGCARRGAFVTLEGVDGAGKSTQVALLVERLRAAGHEVVQLREPGGTAISEKIRALLLDPANGEMAPECELLLFEASRAQLVREVIEPALARGAVVVCDRFYDSTHAYQAGGRGFDDATVRRANELGSCGLAPDVTLVLDMDPALAFERAGKRGEHDRMEAEGLAFQQRVRADYLALAKAEPARVRLVSAVGEPAEVAAAIDAVLAEVGLLADEAPVASGVANEPKALERLMGQPRVRSYLAAAVREHKVGHAYLFLGAPGSGQAEAAMALAECVICANDGCDACDECIRVAHKTHPDVHWIAREGAAGYVVEQVRSLIDDVSLAPIRAASKVYIMERVETLRDTSANALLKTIEEPPAGVVFILMARTADAVLPTIVSRCQLVPFRVSEPAEAARRIALTIGIDENDPAARIALAVAGTPERACEYLRTPSRREARRLMVRTLGELARDDSWDVLCAARDLAAAAKVELDDVAAQQSQDAEENADFLSSKAQKLVEQRNKRELTARERSGIMEVLSAAESLLRDVLMRLEGVGDPIVNADCEDVVSRICERTNTAGALAALSAVSAAGNDLAHNVSPQLALEVMLCTCKEALCPPSSR